MFLLPTPRTQSPSWQPASFSHAPGYQEAQKFPGAPTGAGLWEFYVPLGSLALMSCCDFTNLSFKERVYKKANRTLKARNIPKLGN